MYLDEEKTISVKLYLFDANHTPGYMGTILHTGDMRFTSRWFTENSILYPQSLSNSDFSRCSIHIDELILDNTFCDPIFKFPCKDEAGELCIKIIEENKEKRVFIGIDSLGKEELLVLLAEHFKTKIVVNEERYKNLVSINFFTEIFTTDRNQGFIEVIRKIERDYKLSQNKESIYILATGWANNKDFSSPDNRRYIIPYSCHSNFHELEVFVRSIQPSILNCVVNSNAKSEKIYHIREFSSYMFALTQLKQRGIDFFQKEYVHPEELSYEYQALMDENKQIELRLKLGLEQTPEQKMKRNTEIFYETHPEIYQTKKRMKFGAKLDPTKNTLTKEDNEFILQQQQERNEESKKQQIEETENQELIEKEINKKQWKKKKKKQPIDKAQTKISSYFTLKFMNQKSLQKAVDNLNKKQNSQ